MPLMPWFPSNAQSIDVSTVLGIVVVGFDLHDLVAWSQGPAEALQISHQRAEVDIEPARAHPAECRSGLLEDTTPATTYSGSFACGQ
jgi:hypothetical protein